MVHYKTALGGILGSIVALVSIVMAFLNVMNLEVYTIFLMMALLFTPWETGSVPDTVR